MGSSQICNYDLPDIFKNSYDSIFVTDRQGIVLGVNPACERLLSTTREVLIGTNVKDLIIKGVYDHSTVLDTLKERSIITGLIKTKHGKELMATTVPIIDNNGNIVATVTNSRDTELIKKFMATLKQERARTKRYKSAIDHLTSMNSSTDLIVAENVKMKQILREALTVAKTDSTILILGESGSGKEVLVNYIHQNSSRAQEPLIPVNCAAIPKELLESEFFGYDKGAFTGAKANGKQGIFEIADKGTLFLDEIAELPLSLQSKLLRVIETRKVQRLGSTVAKSMDFRLVAATNKNLKQMVKQGRFREDLYYRLNVIPIYVPPLRERPEDIIMLAKLFLKKFNKKYGKNKILSSKTLHSFLYYKWPGNIRELQNLIERLVITVTRQVIDFKIEATENIESEIKVPTKGTLKTVLQLVESQYIKQIINECNGKISEAASRLGIHRAVLYRKIAFYRKNQL